LGGKFEIGDKPEEGIQREVLEELGLTIGNPRLHGLLMFQNFKGNDWYVLIFTTGELSGGQINNLFEGCLGLIPNAQLSQLNLWESDRIFITCIQDDKLFFTKFVGDKMRGHTRLSIPKNLEIPS
jgi:8-oxo-dGTP diphosphatase